MRNIDLWSGAVAQVPPIVGGFQFLADGDCFERKLPWVLHFDREPKARRFFLQFSYSVGIAPRDGEFAGESAWSGTAYSNVLELEVADGLVHVLNADVPRIGKQVKRIPLKRLLPQEVLETPFPVIGGKLEIRLDTQQHVMLPMEPFMKVYWVGPKDAVKAGTPNDLRGFVTIASPEQALSFVRLKTSPRTFFCFGSEMEVIAKSKIDKGMWYGDARMADYNKKNVMSGFNGIVADEKLGDIPLAKATRSGTGYEVNRILVVEHYTGRDWRCSLVRVVEWVGPDGAYVERSREPFKTKTNIGWYIMHFE